MYICVIDPHPTLRGERASDADHYICEGFVNSFYHSHNPETSTGWVGKILLQIKWKFKVQHKTNN